MSDPTIIEHPEKIGVGTYAPNGRLSEMVTDVTRLGAEWFYTWGSSIPTTGFTAWSVGTGVSVGGAVGDYDMRLTGNSSTGWATHAISVSAGQAYSLTFKGAGISDGTGGLVIEFRNSSGTLISKNDYAGISGAEQTFTLSGAAVPAGAVTAKIVAWGSSGAGIAIDDFSFVVSGSERAVNGALEVNQQIGSLAATYVPMIYGASDMTALADSSKFANTDTILAFNEPDYWAQSNMTVTQALDLWPQLMATGKRLGSPGVSTDQALGSGTWLDTFMKGAAARGYTVDFVAVHYYTDNPDVGAFKAWLEGIYKAYGKPIWVTEWSLADWNNLNRFSYADNAKFMTAAIQMMDDLTFVEKHAWFGTYEDLDGPTYTNLYNADGSLTLLGTTLQNLTNNAVVGDTSALQTQPLANQRPVLGSVGSGTASLLSVAENTTAVTTLVATDPDGPNAISYSIAGGPDAALFKLDSVTGKLSFIAAPDYENPADFGANNVYDIIVRASDGLLYSDQAISITVTDAVDNFFAGTSGNDVFTAQSSADWTLLGGAGNDQLSGAAGNDFIEGGSGDDILRGNSGYDTVSYESASAGVTVNLATTKGQSTGGAGRDTLSGFEAISGSAFGDNLMGDGNANTLMGNGGNDILLGRGGADVLWGGAGADTFKFTATSDSRSGGIDIIRDFRSLDGDHIDLAGIDAISSNRKTLDHFSFSDAGAFSGKAGELIAVEKSPGVYLVQGDVNGDRVADLVIEVHSNAAITGGDFILI